LGIASGLLEVLLGFCVIILAVGVGGFRLVNYAFIFIRIYLIGLK